ncbi:thiolase family protein [Liquorilactobacillus capillatus]|uniref:acetyl-CoA C-acyltransferase n=1 Tax=Liquorilactobacillus capillatus DSM 19910 TaxID=1423731 RepID=A0A0R1MD02_9LACO|nr:thiolase family protein [Liquorilactobacillus capillatus]KRL01336.1 acetyl-CoA acetyltransferase [Liquorilactobacillus capillatus DSM 19910]
MEFNQKVSIIAAERLPIGKVNGMLQNAQPESLYTELVVQQLKKKAISLDEIDQVYLGNVMNQGGNLARRCALAAGLSPTVSAQTIDCQCASGLTAIIDGAANILAGNAKMVLTGGVESNSNANTIFDCITGKKSQRYPMTAGPYLDQDVGVIADAQAVKYGLTRKQIDYFAYMSQRKAYTAFSKGLLTPEILAYKRLIQDECPRFNTTVEVLGQLKSAFTPAGVCTAGNSCPINDGASSVILKKYTAAEPTAGYLLGSELLGCSPEEFILGPVYATQKLLRRFNLRVEQLAAVELNEAFAVQALLCQKKLQIPAEKLNILGGALAYGHPYGATGGILVTHLLNILNRLKRPALGLVTLCVAGGLGASLLIGNAYWSEEDNA